MPKAEYKKVTAKEAKVMIDSGNVTIVDVRTQPEFQEGHIKNAILLTDSDITENAERLLSDKDAEILLYCRSGLKSATAVKELIKMGYTNVYDFGGIADWPYDTVT